MKCKPLSKREVIDAINGTAIPSRVPSTFSIWKKVSYSSPLLLLKSAMIRKKYPSDFRVIHVPSFKIVPLHGEIAPLLSGKRTKAIDSHIALENYDDLDAFLEKCGNDANTVSMQKAGNDKLYNLGTCYHFLFESFWQVRGMENALTDFYLYPDEVHKLFRAFTDYYKKVAIRAIKECNLDGFFMSDDLGHQTSCFFSPDIFNEFFYPYYKEIIDTVHECKAHFWLHTCGNIEKFLPMFIDLQLDVLHPIQKYTMDEQEIFDKYKDKICFLYGFDVQQTIPFGTTEDVRAEIKRTFDIFSKANGRFLFTTGNAVSGNCPIESYQAMIEEAKCYNPYAKINK